MTEKRPFFVAFHGYKGGVGRTVSLANVAFALADAGCRVLIWDLDLKAPNLEDLDVFQDVARRSEGFMTLLAGTVEQLPRPTPDPPIIPLDVNALHKRIVRVNPYGEPNLIAKGETGHLCLLPAYGQALSRAQARLSVVDWLKLYNAPGDIGFNLWESIKEALIDYTPPDQAGPLDFVLMDAESGYSTLAKLAVVQLVDMMVSLFRLSPSAIRRTREGLQHFQDRRRDAESPEFEECLVASLVPDTHVHRKDRELLAERVFGRRPDVHVPFQPSLLLDDRVVLAGTARESTEGSLVLAYEALANHILAAAPGTSATVRRRAEAALSHQATGSAKAFINLAHEQLKLYYPSSALREELQRGVQVLRKRGENRSLAILDATVGLSDDSLGPMVVALGQVPRREGWRGLVRNFTYELERTGDLPPLLAATAALRLPLMQSPWLWATRMAVLEGNLTLASSYLRSAVEEPPPSIEPNPYRPGLNFSPDVFWYRESTVLELAMRTGTLSVASRRGEGRTWLLKMLEALFSRDDSVSVNEMRKKLVHGDRPLPRQSLFLCGRELAERIIATRSSDPFVRALGSGLARLFGESDPSLKSMEALIAACEEPTHRGILQKSVLIIDDMDRLVDALFRSTGEDPEPDIRALLNRADFALKVLGGLHGVVDHPRSLLASLADTIQLREPKADELKPLLEHPMLVQELPDNPNLETIQAMRWGFAHFEQDRLKNAGGA